MSSSSSAAAGFCSWSRAARGRRAERPHGGDAHSARHHACRDRREGRRRSRPARRDAARRAERRRSARSAHDRPADVRRRPGHAARRPRRLSAAPPRRRQPRPNGRRSRTASSSRCALTTKNIRPNSCAPYACFSTSGKTSRWPPRRSTFIGTRSSTGCVRSRRSAASTWTARTISSRCARPSRSMLSAVKDGAAARREILKTAKERGVRYVRLAFVDILGHRKEHHDPGQRTRTRAWRPRHLRRRFDRRLRARRRDRYGPAARSGNLRDPALDARRGRRSAHVVRHRDARRHGVRGVPAFDAQTRARRCRRRRVARAHGARSRILPLQPPARRNADDAGTRQRLVLRFLAQRPRRRNPHRDGGGPRSGWASASRARTTNTAPVSTRSICRPPAHWRPPTISSPCAAIVKHIADRNNIHATFMPKPLETQAGNGLHVYFSLGDVDEVVRLHAIAGLLEHAPGFTAICNPTVNSYKRLVAAWDAPIYTVWSHRSANALVRVPPAVGWSSRSSKCAAPMRRAIPYLAMAVLVESIAEGIRSRALPGDPFTGSTYDLSEQVRNERGHRHAAQVAAARRSPNSTRTSSCAARWAITSITPFATRRSPSTNAIAAPSIPGSTKPTCARIKREARDALTAR